VKKANRFSQRRDYDPKVIEREIEKIKKDVKKRKRKRRNRK